MPMELPKRVYWKHGAWYYVPRPSERHLYGKSWVRLGTTKAEALAACAALIGPQDRATMRAVFARYRAEILTQKADRTQADQSTYIARLEKAFGHFRPEQVRRKHVYDYQYARGLQTQAGANRDIALLSHVFNWGIRWEMVEHNPCEKIEFFEERPRERYVEDAELDAWQAYAPPILGLTAELAYLTGCRPAVLLKMHRTHFTDAGIRVPSVKRGKKGLVPWTPEVEATVNNLLALRRVSSMWVVSTERGQPYTVSGFRAMWRRYMNKAVKEGKLAQPFQLRDLRAKHGTDVDDAGGDATANLLHQSARTTQDYLRSKKWIVIQPPVRQSSKSLDSEESDESENGGELGS